MGAVVLTRDPSSGGDAPVRLRCLTPGTGPSPPTGETPGGCRTAGPGGHSVRWGGEVPDRRPPARWLAFDPRFELLPPGRPGAGERRAGPTPIARSWRAPPCLQPPSPSTSPAA